jgi:hypothetical protein
MRPQDIAAMLNRFAAAEHARLGAKAVTTVGEMIRTVWDDRMRRRLAALLAEGGHELSDIALEAARRVCGGDDWRA